jgi:hypothetical protein
MASRLWQTVGEWPKGSSDRDLEVWALDDELTNLGIDGYVGYEMTLAMGSYILGIYQQPILLCGLAIEEQLALVYQGIVIKDPSRKHNAVRKGVTIALDLDEMNFASLIDWAVAQKVVDAKQAELLREIKDARNLFAHANRIIAPRIKTKIIAGDFKNLVPLVANGVPPLGWFSTQPVALASIKATVSLIKQLDAYYKAH